MAGRLTDIMPFSIYSFYVSISAALSVNTYSPQSQAVDDLSLTMFCIWLA